MEARTRSLRRVATPRRRPGPGGPNRPQPTWPLAARAEPRAYHCFAKCLPRFTWPGLRRDTATCIICRTAVYGPVCTVVWEGRSRETPPYPDCAPMLVVEHGGDTMLPRIGARCIVAKSHA